MSETKTHVIDGQNFTNFAEFTQEFNRAFADIDADWHGNLDAFDDYLDWPTFETGTLETGKGYVLIWRHSAASRCCLGHSAAVSWLQERVQNCHPDNVARMMRRLREAERQQGPTLFDDLVSIIREHQQIELRLG